MGTHTDKTEDWTRARPARALWTLGPRQADLREERLPALAPGYVRIKTLASGISRGTESLVFDGAIPPTEWDRMRAPFQAGTFPFPVKYGYSNVGQVMAGEPSLVGARVFCLHPHQDVYDVPATAVTVVPDSIPAARATLTANMETALNAMWDAGAGPADTIAVVGGGVVGLLVAALAAGLPGARVTVVDVNPDRAAMAERFGAHFALPDEAPYGCDVVFHASASAAGLVTALGAAGNEARVVELSWYGTQSVSAPLGQDFHVRRLQLISSQVGQVAARRRARWDYARRKRAALDLLDDVRFDALLAPAIAFADLPRQIGHILAPGSGVLAQVVEY